MGGTSENAPFAQVQRPRPLPVLVLADVSGSMGEHGKIKVLNESIGTMIRAFAEEDSPHGEIVVGIITFGNSQARLHQPVVPATELRWADLEPVGNTPMGQAFGLVRSLLEDGQAVPAEAYQPTLVLVSDGLPTDAWEEPLDELLASPRGGRATRLAVAVGPEAGSRAYGVLERFIGNPTYPVVTAGEVDRLRQFFQWVTFSVSKSVRAGRPGDPGAFDPRELYDLTD